MAIVALPLGITVAAPLNTSGVNQESQKSPSLSTMVLGDKKNTGDKNKVTKDTSCTSSQQVKPLCLEKSKVLLVNPRLSGS